MLTISVFKRSVACLRFRNSFVYELSGYACTVTQALFCYLLLFLEDRFAILTVSALVMSQKSRSRSPSAADSKASGGSKPSGDNTGAAADDETLTAIAARKSTCEFPLVKPLEVDEAIRVQAEQALTWVRKDEAVRVQSYIDHQYKLYREALPMSAASGKSESVIHAEWAREVYHLHLKAFLSQADCVGEDSFVSPVPPELLPASEQLAAKNLLLELKRNGCHF